MSQVEVSPTGSFDAYDRRDVREEDSELTHVGPRRDPRGEGAILRETGRKGASGLRLDAMRARLS